MRKRSVWIALLLLVLFCGIINILLLLEYDVGLLQRLVNAAGKRVLAVTLVF